MSTQVQIPVQYSQYFGDNFIITTIPNDIMGKIIEFIEPTAVTTINKLNKICKNLSNHDWWYIATDFDNRIPYNENKNYFNYNNLKGLGQTINSICSISKNMRILYEDDNRKSYKNGLGLNEFEKHHIENIYHDGLSNNFRESGTYMCKIKLANKPNYVSHYLRATTCYVSRKATILSFMIADFQRDSHDTFSFKCKQVRITKKIIEQNIDLFLQYKYIRDKTTFFGSSFVLEK
jgi:hypothetical protein